ncbi:MAG: Abi family protein [Christensenellales bacterium]
MKEFFTYEQQILKLKEDGLIIVDENQTLNDLRLEGYYNIINGYSPIFKNDSKFIKGTSFDNIKNLYDFDKTLRSIVYKYTTSIECHIKALIAHEFSRVYGVDEKKYLSTESFSSNAKFVEKVNRLIGECNHTIRDALNNKSNKYREYIEHNYVNHGHVPMWVLIRAISFGTTSIFYKCMKEEEKKEISKNYSITASQLANMLEVVVSFRNIVAHGERTFCAKLPKTRLTTDLSIVKKLCIAKNPKGENKFGRNDFLSLLICCKYLLSPLEFSGFFTEFELALDSLGKQQAPSMFGRIAVNMGLQSKSWKLLPKLKIDDKCN